MDDPSRATDRTTRILFEAHRIAGGGEDVVILTPHHASAEFLVGSLAEDVRSKVTILTRDMPEGADWQPGWPPGLDHDTVVLVDHCDFHPTRGE